MHGNSSTGAYGRSPSPVLRYLNVVGYIVLIVVNVLSNTGFLGPTNADVSKNFPTPLTPAGWAFSIWGLIFLLQGCGVIYQCLPYAYKDDTWTHDVVTSIGHGWQLGWLFECAWQLAFIHQTTTALWFCTVFLLAALYQFVRSLLRLFSLLEYRRQNIPASLYILFLLPTSINAAWLSVASCLGILIVPVSYGVGAATLEPYAAILAVLFSAAGLYFLIRKKDAAYGLTLTWALVAVYGNHRSPWIKTLSLAFVVVLSMFSMFALTRRHSDADSEFGDYEDVHDVLLDTAPSGEPRQSLSQ